MKNPYVYAKSGSLGGVYCLSGFLLTNSGKVLIFSIMNNHYTIPTEDLRIQIQGVLEYIRDNY